MTWLQEFGHENWLIYRNLWLNKGYQVEMDFLIVSRSKWIMVEVKNYDGILSLGEDQSTSGEYLLDRNPLEQVQRSLGILCRVANTLPFEQKVAAALVFINPHCQVVKTDACFKIPVYSRVDLKRFIQGLASETQGSYYSKDNLWQVQDVIDRHRAPNPFAKGKREDCDFSCMYRGFTCGYCLGKKVSFSYRHLHCSECVKMESKNQALIRTVHEYCNLYQRKQFTSLEIFDFIGGAIRYDRVSKILSANLKPDSGFKKKYYLLDELQNNLPSDFERLILIYNLPFNFWQTHSRIIHQLSLKNTPAASPKQP